MAWTQVRLLLPGWYGLSALRILPLDLLREMYREWPFFATTLESAAMALAKADLGVARLYLSLVPENLHGFFHRIAQEYEATRPCWRPSSKPPCFTTRRPWSGRSP